MNDRTCHTYRSAAGTWRRPVTVASLLLVAIAAVARADPAAEHIRQRFEAAQAGYAVGAGGDQLVAVAALADFYQRRDDRPAWWRDGQLRPAATALLRAIRGVDAAGLDPGDYHLAAIEQLERRPGAAPANIEADLDLLLSDAFVLLASNLAVGKVDPATIDPDWSAERRDPTELAVKLLHRALGSDSLPETLEALQPRDPAYRRLRRARTRYTSLAERPWPAFAEQPTIRPGAADPRLLAVRRRLVMLGDLAAADPAAGDDYDTSTEAAVERFQRRHGIKADGVIGPATFAQLNITPAARVRQIDVNLERWRWLPRNLGKHYVLVNIAGFTLRLVEHGQVTFSAPVIAGRSYRRTPVFSDRIRYLVFNPSWTVPERLAVEDKLPRIRRDPGYLKRMGFTLYAGWGEDRRVVDPATVDWSKVSATHFPWLLVQAPGPDNALGRVKFMFPNRYDVYLHDTPSQELFGQIERAFSSGCIRVRNAMQLANRLLAREDDFTAGRIAAIVAGGKTTTVYLREPIPIYIQYWTAWVDEDGTIQFRHDIYGRDEPVAAALHDSPG